MDSWNGWACITDANEARKVIINGDHNELSSAVIDWSNCAEVEISPEGNIWVHGAQSGHWLKDDDLIEFVNWCFAQ
jgi:hypothetical protein